MLLDELLVDDPPGRPLMNTRTGSTFSTTNRASLRAPTAWTRSPVLTSRRVTWTFRDAASQLNTAISFWARMALASGELMDAS